jgi:hypothetical protein
MFTTGNIKKRGIKMIANILIPFYCLVLVAFIIGTGFIIKTTYRDCKNKRYDDGYFMMILTIIPVLLSCLSIWALYHILVKNPFWS